MAKPGTMPDILERLRTNKCAENAGCGVMPACACADMEDAADEIERLRAALDRIAEPEAFYVATARVDPEAFARMIYAGGAVLPSVDLVKLEKSVEATTRDRYPLKQ